MINCYKQFIEKKEIIKDINYFYDQIRDLICNDFFGQYQYNKRKRTRQISYQAENFLSQHDRTRLKFNNDHIVVTFAEDNSVPSRVAISKPIYKNYKIDGITFYINIVLTKNESKSRMIYKENIIFREIRKHINAVNEYYVKKLRKSEEDKYKTIYNKICKIKPSYYSDWNKLIALIKECVNPDFNKNLSMFKEVIQGMDNGLPIVFKMIHQTQFFRNYEHHRQIKFNRFIKSLRKECLDDNEIIHMTKELASCFGHYLKNLDECLDFIENVISHFNTICYVKEMKINKFASKVWSSGNIDLRFLSYEDRKVAKENGLKDDGSFIFGGDINYVELI